VGGILTQYDLETAAHVVQLALTPVFLLSGVATLLAVFSARLARVADKVDALVQQSKTTARDRALQSLRLRSHSLDVAVVLAALAGAFTSGSGAGRLLFLAFGSAIVLTIASLAAFVAEMLLAARGVRLAVDRHVGPVVEGGPPPRND